MKPRTIKQLTRRERARSAAAPLLPPHQRVRDHAAGALLDLLTDDAVGILIAASHSSRAIRDAVANLLAVLATAETAP